MQRLTGPKPDADAAFAELAEAYTPRLQGYAYGIVHDWQTAEDVAQHVLMTVWLHAGDYREEQQFDAWIYRMCRNRCLDILRRAKHDPLRNSAGCDDPFASVCVESVESDFMALDAVERALEDLPFEQRATLELYAQGYTLPEIADASGVSVPTAKSRKRLAAEKLRERLL